ncbi:MAG: glycerate kinase, partial [Rhodobacteraceae bacterium]|nr:glycerate kinase [Paracoccaceae bacterium]
MIMQSERPQNLLRGMFEAAVAAADPMQGVRAFLPAWPQGRLVVVGAGKASARMAQAVESAYDCHLSGIVVTRYGHAVPCSQIEILEAAHPVPDAAGARAAQRILELVTALGADDHCLAVISGGGSALLSMPAPGVTLEDKRAINMALLASGASIDEINCVRKHLSSIKGGRLTAAAHPAQVTSLMISDVPGDDPSVIASGPTVADTTTLAEARDILDRYSVAPSASVGRALEDRSNETPKPGDPRLDHSHIHVIATPQQSLEAAASRARAAGMTPLILGDAIEGEAREIGTVMAGIALQVQRHGQPTRPPCVLISGGETTVTMKGDGRGGRIVEFLLGLAIALGGADGIHAITWI